jgi:nitrous oxide reductase
VKLYKLGKILEKREMKNMRISRRKALSTTAKVATAAALTGIIGGIAGYFAGTTGAAPSRETVTQTVRETVTQTVGGAGPNC